MKQMTRGATSWNFLHYKIGKNHGFTVCYKQMLQTAMQSPNFCGMFTCLALASSPAKHRAGHNVFQNARLVRLKQKGAS